MYHYFVFLLLLLINEGLKPIGGLQCWMGYSTDGNVANELSELQKSDCTAEGMECTMSRCLLGDGTHSLFYHSCVRDFDLWCRVQGVYCTRLLVNGTHHECTHCATELCNSAEDASGTFGNFALVIGIATGVILLVGIALYIFCLATGRR